MLGVLLVLAGGLRLYLSARTLSGEEAPRAAARPRRPVARRRRLRRDRLLASTSRSASIALYALGFTPWVLLAVGLALPRSSPLSYAEGTAAIPEPGGAATFVRRAFNDPAGFLTGWVLFLDYLIVIALAALFVPHYLGARDRLGRPDATSRGTPSSACS